MTKHLIKKSFVLSGHATSIALEPLFWEELQKIATTQTRSLSKLIEDIDNTRTTPLTSSLRVYVLKNHTSFPF